MAYRNKTYVAFASEDLASYRLMTAWKMNERIDFDFFDAHDLNVALDTSQPSTIKRRLRERLLNTKQVVVLLSSSAKLKANRSGSFLYYELEVVQSLELPVVFANLSGSRSVESHLVPQRLTSPYYTVSVSFQPRIIKHALDQYVPAFERNLKLGQPVSGSHLFGQSTYRSLGL